MTESKLPKSDPERTSEADSPTIHLNATPDRKKYERLKAKLRHKQAKRESERKIDHKAVRLSIEAGALSSKTFYIMNVACMGSVKFFENSVKGFFVHANSIILNFNTDVIIKIAGR